MFRSLFLFALAAASFGQTIDPSQWVAYGREPGGSRYSPLLQINKSNVANLTQAWVYRTREVIPGTPASPGLGAAGFEATPLHVDGVLYFSTPGGRVIALDGDTGQQIWLYDSQPNSVRRILYQSRGVSYWQGPAASGTGLDQRILFGTSDGRLIALNAKTGAPASGFGTAGQINMRIGAADNYPTAIYSVTSPPAIYKDLAIVGTALPELTLTGPSGKVRAFNVRTGALVWEFFTVPRPTDFGFDTWAPGSTVERTGTNAWAPMSVDSTRGIVYVPVASPSYDHYGGDRVGANLFGNSLVALDANTGNRLWHYQFVHHDLWDYDTPGQPLLLNVQRNGQTIAAVAQVTKQGFVFFFDRVTGTPLFPINETPVAASNTPGEQAWPTQPIPTLPAPLSRQSVDASGLSRVTSESANYCAAFFSILKSGPLFTPFDTTLSLVLPGMLGGGNWSGASWDPMRNLIYVNANENGHIGAMVDQGPGASIRYIRNSPWGPFARFEDKNGYSCVAPPWGTLNAIDVNTGQYKWKVTLGWDTALKAQGVPKTGTKNLGGTIATASGLVFVGATTDQLFRAFDADTGTELWSGQLEAAAYAMPMTYRGKTSGRQFVVIAAGGGGAIGGPVSDTLVAFALPRP